MSVDSRWVRSEASDAAAREVLIPVLMERDVKIPLEFKLLQAADLCDWQSDPEYPELKALIAQIETMLAHATTATPEQMTPPRGHDLTVATTARESQSVEGEGHRNGGAAGQQDAKPARKKKSSSSGRLHRDSQRGHRFGRRASHDVALAHSFATRLGGGPGDFHARREPSRRSAARCTELHPAQHRELRPSGVPPQAPASEGRRAHRDRNQAHRTGETSRRQARSSSTARVTSVRC